MVEAPRSEAVMSAAVIVLTCSAQLQSTPPAPPPASRRSRARWLKCTARSVARMACSTTPSSRLYSAAVSGARMLWPSVFRIIRV